QGGDRGGVGYSPDWISCARAASTLAWAITRFGWFFSARLIRSISDNPASENPILMAGNCCGAGRCSETSFRCSWAETKKISLDSGLVLAVVCLAACAGALPTAGLVAPTGTSAVK